MRGSRHQPTEQLRRSVRAMAAYGMPQIDIAASVDISVGTLRKHYAEEISIAAAEANAKVAQTLFKTATDQNHKSHVTAAIFWLKTRAGWTERNAVEHSGPNGGPIETTSRDVSANLASLSDEELAEYKRLTKKVVEGETEGSNDADRDAPRD